MMVTKQYDIALSFAGEDRMYAEALAEALLQHGVRVFYDKYELSSLWGKNLYTYFSDLYQHKAKYCIMFLSRHYAAKLWTNHEREAAQARSFKENEEYILPIRLDNTEIPGILPTISYLDWHAMGVDVIANAVIEKLNNTSALPPSASLQANALQKEAFSHGYALLIGVGSVSDPKLSLPVTVQDARALRSILADPSFCAYPDNDQHIRFLHDSGATYQAILDGLDWLRLQTEADPDSTSVVYYSGHGCFDKTTNLYYLVQHDTDSRNISGTALPAQIFTEKLHAIQAKRLLVFIDSCHAEGMATAKNSDAEVEFMPQLIKAAFPNQLAEKLKQGEGRAVFTSSRGKQSSWVRPDGAMSIYTFHLMEALKGAGNRPGDTEVYVSNLMRYLGKTVAESARRWHGVEQTPFFDTATEDFPVALLCGGKGLSEKGQEFFQHEVDIQNKPRSRGSGERSIAIGGNVSGSTIISGDHNKHSEQVTDADQ